MSQKSDGGDAVSDADMPVATVSMEGDRRLVAVCSGGLVESLHNKVVRMRQVQARESLAVRR